MKRSPLNPGTSRLKRTGFLRHAALKSAGKPLKPVRRYDPTEKVGRAVVCRRSDGRCELCGINPAAEWQHRKNRSQGGTWAPTNGLHSCSGCHRWIHENPAAAVERGWMVKAHATPALVPFLHHTLGYLYLDDAGNYHIDLEEAS